MDKSKLKENFLNISKVIIFLLIFVLLLNVLSPIFSPKNNNAKSGIKYETARGFYGEKINSIDVVAIGNSDLYSGMIPLQIWKEHGITSYVCAEPQQTIMNAYFLLKDVLTCQKPKLVILEVDELFSKTDADDLDNAFSATLRNYFPIFEYHSRWKDLKKEDFQDDIHYTTRNEAKGYYYNQQVKPYNGGFDKYMKKKAKRKKLTNTTEFYLDKLIKFIREDGSDIMFMCSPSASSWSTGKSLTIQEIANSYNINFIDFNTNYKETGFNWVTDSRDGGNHLNYKGAVKMTDYLGKYLRDNYSLSDHRGDENYSGWDKDYILFMNKVNNKE